METINQKMAFLSAFKLPPHHSQAAAVMAHAPTGQASAAAAAMAAKFNTIGPSVSAYYFGNGAANSGTQPGHHQPRSSSSNQHVSVLSARGRL